MKQSKLTLIIALLLLFLNVNVTNSLAAQISTDYLLSVCESSSDGKELVKNGHVTCQAYIAGVMDYHTLYAPVASPSVSFCIPNGVSLGELQKVVVSYIKRNPQHMGFVASPAVILALYEKYPCKR